MAGAVKITRDSVIVDLGSNAEALLPRDQMIPRETSEWETVYGRY